METTEIIPAHPDLLSQVCRIQLAAIDSNGVESPDKLGWEELKDCVKHVRACKMLLVGTVLQEKYFVFLNLQAHTA